MARETMATLRKRNAELQRELAEMKRQRQKFLDACTAGVMHIAGVERWIEDVAAMFVRVAERAGTEREALNSWIGSTVALSGQIPK